MERRRGARDAEGRSGVLSTDVVAPLDDMPVKGSTNRVTQEANRSISRSKAARPVWSFASLRSTSETTGFPDRMPAARLTALGRRD